MSATSGPVIAAGEAVLWPADIPHGAWTEHSEMRVIMVELAGADDSVIGGFLEQHATDLSASETPVARADGALRDDGNGRRPGQSDEGEPA